MPAASVGLASSEGAALRPPILAAWDAFLDVVETADLSQPSRLKGLTGRDVLVHLGTWDDHQVLKGLAEAARHGDQTASGHADDINKDLLARHKGATDDDVRKALDRSRAEVADWFETSGPDELGLKVVSSMVGDLPLLTVLNAGSYELAVHALDLTPCGASKPSDALLDRGLAALMDVTAALAAQHDIDMTLTAQAPEGGWTFTTAHGGWTTATSSGKFAGPGVRGAAADILDGSAGRAQLPGMVLKGKFRVQDMAGFLRLAPMIDDVPGLPGGPVLRRGIKALNGVVGRFRR